MPMGAARLADVVTRFNREDHKRTKHDSQFSKWKILIGPHDWEDHLVGKEGVARYRVENLPKSSNSGLYELAIYRADSSSRANHGKLDPDKVLVVYLGEADNVRTRLQQYGRTGAHLGRNGSGDKVCGCFEDIFARGYSIVYRWAPMENKAEARKTEAQLLDTFDYAWNKGSNGVRRHDDILQKLDKPATNLTKLTNFSRKHLPFLQKQVGIKIKATKLLSDNNEFSKSADGDHHNFLWQVFKFSRSQPRLVPNHGDSNENETITCGVVLEDGSICKTPPVKGRKRCSEHKGKKTKGSSTKSNTIEKSQLHKGEYPEIEHCSPICGVASDDGSLCRRQPISGRKRCDLHGRRIYSSNSDEASIFDKKSSEFFLPGGVETVVSLERPVFSEGCNTICGVELGDGYLCTKQPVNGNGKCWQHLNHGVLGSSVCGAPTPNGSFCRRTVKGNGRCWQH